MANWLHGMEVRGEIGCEALGTGLDKIERVHGSSDDFVTHGSHLVVN